VSAHFGPTNFGLAWGMVSYFAAVGAVLFSVRGSRPPNLTQIRFTNDVRLATANFSPQYLFALVSTAVAEQADVIPGASGPSILKADEAPVYYGPKCFRPTLWVSAVCCVVAALGLFLLGRRWKV
jgi:hypothetical protein